MAKISSECAEYELHALRTRLKSPFPIELPELLIYVRYRGRSSTFTKYLSNLEVHPKHGATWLKNMENQPLLKAEMEKLIKTWSIDLQCYPPLIGASHVVTVHLVPREPKKKISHRPSVKSLPSLADILSSQDATVKMGKKKGFCISSQAAKMVYDLGIGSIAPDDFQPSAHHASKSSNQSHNKHIGQRHGNNIEQQTHVEKQGHVDQIDTEQNPTKQNHVMQNHTEQSPTKQNFTKQNPKQGHTNQNLTKQNPKQNPAKQQHTEQIHAEQNHAEQIHTEKTHTKPAARYMEVEVVISRYMESTKELKIRDVQSTKQPKAPSPPSLVKRRADKMDDKIIKKKSISQPKEDTLTSIVLIESWDPYKLEINTLLNTPIIPVESEEDMDDDDDIESQSDDMEEELQLDDIVADEAMALDNDISVIDDDFETRPNNGLLMNESETLLDTQHPLNDTKLKRGVFSDNGSFEDYDDFEDYTGIDIQMQEALSLTMTQEKQTQEFNLQTIRNKYLDISQIKRQDDLERLLPDSQNDDTTVVADDSNDNKRHEVDLDAVFDDDESLMAAFQQHLHEKNMDEELGYSLGIRRAGAVLMVMSHVSIEPNYE